MEGSWLLPDGIDRERMLDMDRRIRPARRAAFAVLAVSLLLMGPWLGYWTVLPVVAAAIVFRVAETRIDRARRPEYGLFSAWVGAQLILASSIAVTGGPTVATMSWLALPLVTLAARYSERAILLGVTITLGLLCAVAYGVDARAVMEDPTTLIAPVALVIAITLLTMVLMRSEKDNRAEAVIDPLTGLLNRKALASRAAELEQQTRMTGAPVGLLVADLDHFKAINDQHGHGAGDNVLRDVAYRMRTVLRGFDRVYRLGGEEFVIVVADAGPDATLELAEALRAAIAAEPVAGIDVTLSVGVACSEPGTTFSYDAQFAAADAALYAAKADGRDRVRAAGAVLV